MRKLILAALAACCILVFSNCSKSGPPGPQGPQGIPGLDGNANVIGANPFTVYAGDWTYTTNNGLKAYWASFNLADITTAVADHGLVEIYILYPDGTWKNLPDIYNGTSFSYNFSAGGFDIYYTNVDGSVPSAPSTQTFRTVIIPSSLRQAYPGEDWKNYDRTMALIKANSSTSASVSQ